MQKIGSILACLTLIMGSFFVSGCSSDDDDTSTPAATTSNDKCTPEITGYTLCHKFLNWSTTGLAQAKTDCESADELGGVGTWVENSDADDSAFACTTIDVVGNCTWAAGSDSIVTQYSLSTEIIDAAAASSHCTSAWSGTFEAS